MHQKTQHYSENRCSHYSSFCLA